MAKHPNGTSAVAKVNLGLSTKATDGIVKVLSVVLADEEVLRAKLQNYHWNVVGPHFISLHKLFEEQYDAITEEIDVIAEMIRSYGANAIGTLAEFSQRTRLEEQPGEYPDADSMVANLTADHEVMIRHLREDITKVDESYDADVASIDYLTGLLEKHMKFAWMLRVTNEG